jgi:aminoglycoside phosphotransferase (APT) family kinase protein
VLDTVRREALTWFPELSAGPVAVTVERRDARPRGAVTVLSLSDGRTSRRVVAKTTDTSSAEPLAVRPRLGIDDTDLARRDQLEWEGLVRAWRACGDGHRPGLTAIRPLAHLADDRTVVMSHLDGRTLRSILAAGGRASAVVRGRRVPSPDELRALLRRLGAWLAGFHSQGADVEAKRSDPKELSDVATAYASFFADRGGGSPAATLAELLASTAPTAPVALGLGHGDFAPRNALVTNAGEVAVLDVLARWRVPIHEDLALLLLELRTGGLQLVTAGHAFAAPVLRGLQASLLEGYEEEGGAGVDLRTLRWFSGLVLADRWAAHLTRSPAGAAGRLRHALVGRELRRQFARVLAELEDGSSW